MKYKCPVCEKNWKKGDASILCSNCNGWVHHNNRLKCSKLSNEDFVNHTLNDDLSWTCVKCDLLVLPFNNLNDNDLMINSLGINSVDVNVMFNDDILKFRANCDNLTASFGHHEDDDEEMSLDVGIDSKYYDIGEFTKCKPDKSSSFSMLNLNIASISKHIDDLRLILSLLEYNWDIIGISEHKIKKGRLSTVNIDLTGYNEFIFQPTETDFGGTGFYIRNNIDFIERPDLSFNSAGNYESSFVEIILKGKKNLIVGCIYRHPTSVISVEDFNQLVIEPLLEKILKEKKQCSLLGDFNINLLKYDSHKETRDFLNSMTSAFFSPFILQPTRLSSKSLIDNIFFNSLEFSSYSGNLLIEISDHLMQFLIIEGFVKEKAIPEINLYKRNFKHFNDDEFSRSLYQLDWENIVKIEDRDINASYSNFYRSITFLLDEFAPFYKVSKKEYKLKFKPWINSEILDLIKERDKVFKTLSKEKNDILKIDTRNRYKQLRNKITDMKRTSKTKYFKDYFEKNRKKTTEIWKGIKSLVNIKCLYNSSYKLLDANNNLISNQKQMANIFNNYFVNIGLDIEKKISKVKSGNINDYINNINCDKTLFLVPVVSHEIAKVIDSLDINKSTGPNSIPVFIIKILKPFFSDWLAKLINLSFETSVFPDILKVAKVIPIHKKNSKLDHVNYRPISLLSVFSKIYEKILYKRIYGFLSINNLFYEKQYGFRSRHSTNHALISVTEKIKSLLDNGKFVAGVFIDLEKAFDTVNHKYLCEKLKNYGLRGNINLLIKSYLTDRKQFVSINGFDSEIKYVKCGVPQGSSLGPLLFLIYINDFRYSLVKSDCGHFADDTFIMYSSNKLKTIETVLNHELKLASNWLKINKLSLNKDKTKLIIFHSKRKYIDKLNLSIKIDGHRIPVVDKVNYLGMFLDEHLSWEFHINQLSTKLSRGNGILSKLRYYVPQNTLIQVYYAIFHSYLYYGCAIWGQAIEKYLDIIRILQKKCVRIMTFAEFRSHSTPIFQTLGLIKLDDVIRVNILNFVYDFIHNLLPEEFKDFYTFRYEIHNYNNRFVKDSLYINRVNTVNYGIKTICYQGPLIWNELIVDKPLFISMHTKSTFQYNIKKYFMSSYV